MSTPHESTINMTLNALVSTIQRIILHFCAMFFVFNIGYFYDDAGFIAVFVYISMVVYDSFYPHENSYQPPSTQRNRRSLSPRNRRSRSPTY